MPTGWRNRWNIGSWLVIDEESGFTEYAEDVAERWDGTYFRRQGNEDEVPRHPQEFVRAKGDPYPAPYIRPRALVTAYAQNEDVDLVQGIELPTGAAQHLFVHSELGIGEMFITDGSADIAITCAKAFTVRSG